VASPSIAAPARTRSSQKRCPRPPGDPGLPSLRALLDPDIVAAALQRTLRGGTGIEALRVRFVDYRPGVACTIAYHAMIDGHLRVASATADAAGIRASTARRQETRSIPPSQRADPLVERHATYDAALHALLRWYPVDPSMRVVAMSAADLTRLTCGSTTAPAPVETLLYRPGQRTVLRQGGLVLKAYADVPAYRAAVGGLRASRDAGGVQVPAIRGVSTRFRLTVQTAVDGVPIERDRAVAVAAYVGATLRVLHACQAPGLRMAPATEQLAAAGRSAQLVAAVAPALGPRVATLLGRLVNSAPTVGPAVFSHGDFNISQLLEADGQLVVLDFDHACLAAPALDVAGYAANLVSGRPGDPEHASAALDALLDGYGSKPDGVQWHLAATTLRRASSPFRLHKKDWPERMAAILDAAEAMVVA
jgi:hypothetical protein